jgi:hypothetical protein
MTDRIKWVRRWLAAIACLLAIVAAGPAAATPSYMSYYGLARNIPQAQDHVNLYWAVSWTWQADEVLSELADARARGLRAIVHTEFAFFNGSGPWATACPYTLRPDAAARWDSFAQSLSRLGLVDTVAAFYPLDEPDLCPLSPADVLTVLDVIRTHPLTAGKPVAAIFTCDIAKKYGGPYQLSGGHQYRDALRAYDWVGVDCYGTNNMFTDAAWSTRQFDFRCFCFRSTPGPNYYDNLKAQLDLTRQRLILVPQGFLSAEGDAWADDPQVFADKAATDPAVILLAPFTWFDQPFYPGVRSQPALAQQWRDIGKSIAANAPSTVHLPLPAAVQPRLQVSASDLRHFSVLDRTCNSTMATECAVELDWQLANANTGTRLFMREGTAASQFVSCSPAMGYADIPRISTGVGYTFDIYQDGSCATTLAPGLAPIATINVSLATSTVVSVVPYPNYQGLWWNSPPGSEAGWGINFAHQGDTIFATWFTFGLDGKPLWLVVSANRIAANVYSGKLFTGTGPAFDAMRFDPGEVVPTEVGTATFSFADSNNATFTYAVNGVTQAKQITRQHFDSPVPSCTWGVQPNLAVAANYQDIWWAAPAGIESGWGINFTHEGDTIFATWFTFGLDGKPLWLAVGAPRTGANSYSGVLYRVSGPPFSAPFDPGQVVATPVGNATFTFTDGSNATFAYAVDGISQSKKITREVFAAPGTLCR